MNFDPIFQKLGKIFSGNKENAENEIDKIDLYLKEVLKQEFNPDKSEGSSRKERRVGDLNNDGKIDFDDVLMLKDVLEGKRELDEKELEYADLNHDGVVDYKDLNLMIDLVFESRKAEDRVMELQGVYDEMQMREEKGLASSSLDKLRMGTVKSELEQAIANFILQSYEGK